MDQAFAAANTIPNYNPAAVVTGEHSGLENPNMTAGLTGAGVTIFAQDGSRQPTQYCAGGRRGRASLPEQHLLQRLQLARPAQRVQHAVCRVGYFDRQR